MPPDLTGIEASDGSAVEGAAASGCVGGCGGRASRSSWPGHGTRVRAGLDVDERADVHLPGETLVLAIAPSVGLFIIGVVIYVMLAGERLVVCERGVLLGSVAPFMRPYAIRYDQIVVGSVVPISAKITRYTKQTGLLTMTTVRISWWSKRGVSFAGPSPAEARGSFGATASSSQDVGVPWLIGTRAPAEQVTADIARAAQAAGFTELSRQTATAPPRVLSGNAADNPVQLPGVIVPGGR